MKKPQPKPKKDQKALVYFITMLTFLGLSLGTEFHEVLHQFFAYINGWGITESVAGLTTGSTTAILEASKSATTWSIWWFYMFPSTAIFAGAFLINVIKPSRFIRVLGIVVMALNLASFDPGNIGSDAYKAAQLLVAKGWSEIQAYGLQYIIAIIFIAVYGLYLYIVIENSDRDTVNRAKRVI